MHSSFETIIKFLSNNLYPTAALTIPRGQETCSCGDNYNTFYLLTLSDRISITFSQKSDSGGRGLGV